MNTFLSTAQESLKEQYRAFAREQVAPAAAALERREQGLSEFLQVLGQHGYLGITIPQQWGGQGAPFLNAVLFVEAVCEFEPGLGLTLAAHFAATEILARYGNEAQKSRYLPLLSRGESLATVAVAEEQAGSDFRALRTRVSGAEGKQVLEGRKVWVVNAELSGLLLVAARSGEDEKAAIEMYLVESGGTGVRIGKDRSRLGLRSAFANDVDIVAAPLAPDNRLGPAGAGDELVVYGMDVAKVVLAAAALGLSEGALGLAAEHARSRQQFGRAIGQFQAVQWKLADHATETAGARLQVYRAAWSKDESAGDFHRYAAMCKWLAAGTARRHSGEALQILATYGMAEGQPAERFYRDAKMMEICEGTQEMQKVLLVEELDI